MSCQSICTHFLSQINQRKEFPDLVIDYPSIFDCRIISSSNGRPSNHIKENYKRCSFCEIYYHKNAFGGNLIKCICCNSRLTLGFRKGGRN